MALDPTGSSFFTHIWGYVYRADISLELLGSLPLPVENYRDFVFSPDGGLVYAALSTEASLSVFGRKSLALQGIIPLRGYAFKLAHAGNLVISASRPSINANKSCLEVVSLEGR